jgi:hypothetical protein
MTKATVTYKAPKGDSKVVEIFGHTFFDGKAETVDLDDDALEKLKNHPLFDCGGAASSPMEPEDEGDDKHPKPFPKGGGKENPR